MRPGTGPKPKRLAEKVLQGTATVRERTAVLPAVDEFDAPHDLATDERLVWLRLAPHAFKARTLTMATEYQFVMLCRNIVLERVIALDPDQRGRANHRGIIQRIDAELARFCLSPMGKPLVEEAPRVEDAFAEFDGSVN